MPQFIIGHSLKPAAEKYPLLRNSLWLLEAALFRIIFTLLGWLPVETASRLGQRITVSLGPRLKKNKTFRRNIDMAFPALPARERDSIVRGIWANLGAIIGEFPHLKTICHDEKYKRLKIAVAGHIEALQKPGKPVIIVTGHLSNWEVAGAAVAQMGIPCADAYTPMGNPWLDRMIARYREPLEVELFPREESMRPMVRHLVSGQSLAFVMDQRIDNGQAVPFMGMSKMTTVVPAKLGLRFDCEIVPLRVQRLGNAEYLVTFYPPVTADHDNAPEEQRILQITRKINDLLGEWIAESPTEWFPSKRRWDKIAGAAKSPQPDQPDQQATHATD